jgi:hypothetical protein
VGTLGFEELMVRDALISDDPVEQHIIKKLQRLRHQNKRLKSHIEKTGTWAHLKEVDLWKPFDFYHYFCSKFQDRYGREYRQTGNIVLTYQKIDEFRIGNHLTKQEYKNFIDHSFEKYFNNINIPRIGHICNIRLYNHLMGEKEASTPEEFHELDRELLKESAKFEEYIQEFNNG